VYERRAHRRHQLRLPQPGGDLHATGGATHRGEHHAGQVEAAPLVAARLGYQRADREHRDRDQRQVDEEDRAPPEVVQQPAAQQRAERDAERVRGDPDGQGAGAFGGVEEHGEHGGGERARSASTSGT